MADITATCVGIGIGALGRDPSLSRFYDACGRVHSVESEGYQPRVGREGAAEPKRLCWDAPDNREIEQERAEERERKYVGEIAWRGR